MFLRGHQIHPREATSPAVENQLPAHLLCCVLTTLCRRLKCAGGGECEPKTASRRGFRGMQSCRHALGTAAASGCNTRKICFTT